MIPLYIWPVSVTLRHKSMHEAAVLLLKVRLYSVRAIWDVSKEKNMPAR